MPWEAWGTSWTEYGDIFNEGVGTIKGFQAKLHVKSDVKSSFSNPAQSRMRSVVAWKTS